MCSIMRYVVVKWIFSALHYSALSHIFEINWKTYFLHQYNFKDILVHLQEDNFFMQD